MRVRTIQDLAGLVRGRRRDLRLSQAGLAGLAGVSRTWLYDFERGKATVELRKVLLVLDALDLSVEVASRSASRESHGAQVAPKGRAGSDLVDLDELLDAYQEDR